MTVPSENTKISYTGDGSTTTFPFNFKIFNKNDLLVMAGTSQQTVDVDYTVTGVGEASGGDVIFTSAPADGTGVVILRQMSLLQETEYIASGAFPSTAHEAALDRLTMMVQQLDEKLSRTPQIALTEGITGLEIPAPGAGYAIGWNPSGDQLALVTAGGGAGGAGGGAGIYGGMVTGSLVDADGSLLSDGDGAIVISFGDISKAFMNSGTSQPSKAVNYPYALYDSIANKTIVAVQVDTDFEQHMVWYDHATGAWSDSIKIADGVLSEDSHGNAALCIDSDGKYHAFYGTHNSELLHLISDNAHDPTAWSTGATASDNCTYPKVMVYGDEIHIFHRNFDGEASQANPWAHSKSADKGATWNETEILERFIAVSVDGGVYCGHPAISADGTQIFLPFTARYDKTIYSLRNVYVMVFDITDDHVYAVDGTDLGIKATEVEAEASLKIVNTGSDESSLPTVRLDANGYPHVIYCKGPAGTTGWKWYHVYWNGSSWSTPVEICDFASDSHGEWAISDFEFTSPTSITAYLEMGLDIDSEKSGIHKYKWISGSGWSFVEEVLSANYHGLPISNVLIPKDHHADIELIFSDEDDFNYTNATLKSYAYDGSDFVSRVNTYQPATSGFAMYILDADSGLPQNPPYVLKPTNNAGDKRWILQPNAVSQGAQSIKSASLDQNTDYVLSHGDLVYQLLYPKRLVSGNCDVVLDSDNCQKGDLFIIINTGKGHGTPNYNGIEVYADTAKNVLIDYVYPGSPKGYIYDGYHWHPALPGSASDNNMSDRHNTVYGSLAYSEDGGSAFGYQANASNKGTAIGKQADANNIGVAVGERADTHDKVGAVALGFYAYAKRTNEMAKPINYSTNRQNHMLWEGWYGETSDATPTEIFLGGVSNERFDVEEESVASFEIQIVARDNVAGHGAFYTITGAIKRDGSDNTALLAAVTKTVIHEDDGSWDVAVTADDANEALIITVTGDASNPVRWGASARFTEVSF